MTVKERYTRRAARSPRSNAPACQEKPVAPETSIIREKQDQGPNVPAPEPLHRQYLGGMTCMLHNAPGIPPNYRRITATSTTKNQAILTIIDPMSPPPAILLSAYVDAYFQHVFHRLPVIDRADFSSSRPSVALQQAICMVGTILRHPKGPDILAESEKYYYNVKTLIHTNHEQDPITVLKVMCLFSTRNIAGPVLLTIDSPWQWLVIAIRLLQQMGLHREEMCAAFVNPKIARRIAWSLFVRVSPKSIFTFTNDIQVQDILVSAAFGWPTSIKKHEFDVRPLTEEDFESSGIQSLLFIELAKIISILGSILDLRGRSTKHVQTQVRAPRVI